MKTIYLFISGCLVASLLQAQDPFLETRLVNRNVHEQDGQYLIITMDASTYIYAKQDESILSNYFNPLLITEEDTTGIANILPIPGLHLYPNPVHDVLRLERDESKEDYHIEFITMDGISLHKTKWPAGVSLFQFGATSLPSGTFVVTVTSQDFSRRSQYKVLKK